MVLTYNLEEGKGKGFFFFNILRWDDIYPWCLFVNRLGAEDWPGPGRDPAVLHWHAGEERERGAQAGQGGADHAGGQVSHDIIRPLWIGRHLSNKMFRILWEKKKKEEEDLLFRDLEELKELSRAKMFGRYNDTFQWINLISILFLFDTFQARPRSTNPGYQEEKVYWAPDEQLDQVWIWKWWQWHWHCCCSPGPSRCLVSTPRLWRPQRAQCQGEDKETETETDIKHELCVRYESQPTLDEGVRTHKFNFSSPINVLPLVVNCHHVIARHFQCSVMWFVISSCLVKPCSQIGLTDKLTKNWKKSSFILNLKAVVGWLQLSSSAEVMPMSVTAADFTTTQPSGKLPSWGHYN